MNEQFTRQAQEMFSAAKDARIPENVQAFAEESVAKTRDLYQKMNAAAKDNVKAVEEVVMTAQSGARALSEKVLNNAAANADAAFEAAQAIARARTIPEAARLQADFIQQQIAAASLQTKELFELSTKMAQQTFACMNSAAKRCYLNAKTDA
ncbi:MAG TPA: phasin family protein [Hyphomicrobiaceae bacterium]|jgi:hypothetical protein